MNDLLPEITRPNRRKGLLDLIEWLGNSLPEPATLFVLAALLVMVLSHVGSLLNWSVQPLRPRLVPLVDATGRAVVDENGRPRQHVDKNEKTGRCVLEPYGDPIRPVSLLTRDGAYWAISSMVNNFVLFPPLGIILTAMLGVGVAERAGLIAVLLKALARAIPKSLLVPTIIFLGVNSSLTSDAGYVVLPPAAAALFLAAGRSPLVGIAAATAGVAGGFSANLLLTPSDAVMAGFTQSAARIIDPAYLTRATCNWYFMIGSTFVLSLAGWAVTALFVEPKYAHRPADEGGPSKLSQEDADAQRLTSLERRALKKAAISFGLILSFILAAILFKPGPLHGDEPNSSNARWIQSIVPLIFLSFLIPGIVYGVVAGRIRREKDVSELLIESMKSMSAVVVVYFFAAQFIAYFGYSNLGRMLSIMGGQYLATSSIPSEFLLLIFLALVLAIDFLMTSMSAKYAIMAPIFVPMFMLIGISPELTQAAYRVGDSVANSIAPLNPYQVIMIKEMQKYAPKSGMGTLISMNTPYAITFAIVWAAFLLLWMKTGLPLGQFGSLRYVPTGG